MQQLKQKDIKPLREKLLKKNESKCPICLAPLDPSDAALDHDHDTGQIRNTICKKCNSYEGVVKSKWKRSGLMYVIGFSDLLRRLADYLDAEQHLMLHPSHKPGPRKLMKSSYNFLVREIEKCNKYLKKPVQVPPYPKSKRLTKRLKELYEKYGITPKYYCK